MGIHRQVFVSLVVALLAARSSSLSAAPTSFVTVQAILVRNCSACHDWTGSRDAVVAGDRVLPKDPDNSVLYKKIASDEMPAVDQKLSADEKATIREWILAGASDQSPTGAAAAPLPARRVPAKIAFHAATGFTATAAFTAAGVLGVIHYLDMKNVIHPGGVAEGDGSGEDSGQMTVIWNSQQNLRWWHVGLVVTGETLYLGDALTGLSMSTRRQSGPLTRHDLHRYAFFTHLTLMAAQLVLGFLETDALSHGRHDASIAFTGAHALIGIAIPSIMLYAGLENILP